MPARRVTTTTPLGRAMTRNIDHLVIAVVDLESARATWQRLGFTVTPTGRHPFGTANALVQLHGNYIELLEIRDPAAIPEADVGVFSFAAFNRDFLLKREGASMLALKSDDAAADRADFEAHGLPVFAALDFERTATGPDGTERKVAFSLTFTREARLREAGFFACQHHFPENFWHSEFQHHANGAARLASIVLVTRDPADFHAFVTHLTGQHDMKSTSLGVTFDLGGETIEILSPFAYRAWFGGEPEPDPRRLLACRIAVGDLGQTRRTLDGNSVAYSERQGALVVSSDDANGVTLAFIDPAFHRQ